ncbi:MAG: isocitrate lyase/phosphoenolpyruvate mutase family protein [bacterium]
MKTPTLKRAIQEHRLIRAMAAHSPLSAMLVEEAGFNAIWASGFELSALYGLADVSLITMSEHLAMVRAMAARCSIPIVADIDTGFGNAINVIHTVREYERAGAAAVVIEDKQFPKVTSLREGARQELVRVEEFQGKIEAAVQARQSEEFMVIARTEALIAGQGDAEALRRARAYADAGADMILVHSKQKTSAEIERFVAAWDRTPGIVIVPTSYPDLDEQRIVELARIHMVIYGNHGIRAAVRAMRETFAEVARSGSAASVQNSVASVEEIFALQGMDRLADDERRFLR